MNLFEAEGDLLLCNHFRVQPIDLRLRVHDLLQFSHVLLLAGESNGDGDVQLADLRFFEPHGLFAAHLSLLFHERNFIVFRS